MVKRDIFSTGIFYASFFLFSTVIVISSCVESKLDKALSVVTEQNLRQHVEFLASDECSGRLPLSAGADLAADYIAEQMDSIGLVPFDGKFFKQEVALVKMSTEVQDFITVNTPSGPMKIVNHDDFSIFTHTLESEIDVRGAELIFAGYGIVAPEYGKDDYRGLDHPENKIAIVIVNDPGLGSGTDNFSGDTMTYYGRWTYKFEEGARHSLKGVLIIHDDWGAGYGWSVASANKERYVLDTEGSSSQPVCDVPVKGWLSNNCARQLLSGCGYDMDELIVQARKSDFKPIDLNASFDVKLNSTFAAAKSPNIVGYIPADRCSEESIVCIAHWDHIGHTRVPIDGDDIVNGATDNATAVAWLLETARAFKELERLQGRGLKRNIVFLSPTCEEVGMYGSEYYVSHPVFPIEKTVAVVNLDVLPLWGENNDVTITGWGYSDLDSMLQVFARKQGRYIMADPDSYNGMFYRSDHLPFMRKGVPAIFAKGWSDNRIHGKEWATEKIADYWANIYHKPADETHPGTDDYSGLKQEVDLFFHLIFQLASTDVWPQWSEKSEFQRQ